MDINIGILKVILFIIITICLYIPKSIFSSIILVIAFCMFVPLVKYNEEIP